MALAGVLLAGCAGPQPVLNPNEQLRAVGQAQADQDIAECRQLAEQAGASEGSVPARPAVRRTVPGGAIGGAVGPTGGAVLGRPGTGATAGLMPSTFGGSGEPSQAYRNVVDRCLRERGYDPAGWD